MLPPETIPITRRINAVLGMQADGSALLHLSVTPPAINEPSAVFIWQGMLPGDLPMDIPLMTASSAKLLGTVTVTQTAAIALSAGIRSVTLAVSSSLGIKAGDNLLLFPTGALPAGYALHNAVATSATALIVYFTAPLLAIGASFSIPCRVMRIG